MWLFCLVAFALACRCRAVPRLAVQDSPRLRGTAGCLVAGVLPPAPRAAGAPSPPSAVEDRGAWHGAESSSWASTCASAVGLAVGATQLARRRQRRPRGPRPRLGGRAAVVAAAAIETAGAGAAALVEAFEARAEASAAASGGEPEALVFHTDSEEERLPRLHPHYGPGAGAWPSPLAAAVQQDWPPVEQPSADGQVWDASLVYTPVPVMFWFPTVGSEQQHADGFASSSWEQYEASPLGSRAWSELEPSTPHSAEAPRVKLRASEREGLEHRLRSGAVAERKAVLTYVLRNTWSLAQSKHGCEVVQTALMESDISIQIELANSLRGHVLDATRSPHANHVLQLCIERLPPECITFVAFELVGHGRDCALRNFGCRVCQRLLEHFPGGMLQGLAEEWVSHVVELSGHRYGNFVVQHLFEYGQAEQRSAALRMLLPSARALACHQCGSKVVQKALAHCGLEEQDRLVRVLGDVPGLEQSMYGSFVARELRRR